MRLCRFTSVCAGVPVLVCVATTLAFALTTAAPSFATSGATSWGDNEQGQLGNGSTSGSDLPGAVTGLGDGVSAISAGTRIVPGFIPWKWRWER